MDFIFTEQRWRSAVTACTPVGLVVDRLERLNEDARDHERTVDYRQRLKQPVGRTLLAAAEIT